MNRYRQLALGLVLGMPVYAHHSDAPHFDLDREIVLEARITDFRLVNPHAYVYFTVEGSTGDWRCELPAALTLRRLGWSENTLRRGQTITINASPARREANHCYLNSFTLADGTVVPREDAGPVLVAQGAATERPLRLANGQPNFTGDWAVRSRSAPQGRPQPTAAGLAAGEAFEYEYDHPALRCESVNIIHGWPFSRFVNRVEQTDDAVILTYGYMDLVRRIHLSGSEHPEDIVPSVAGHSIGRWEGDVLVVDTVGIMAGAVSPLRSLMHSDQYTVVERFWYDEEDRVLIREYTATDPLYFEAPFSGRDIADISAVTYEPYDCIELSGDNNIRQD